MSENEQLGLDIGEPAVTARAAPRKGRGGSSSPEPPAPPTDRRKRATKDKDERAADSVPRKDASSGVAGADRNTPPVDGGAPGADRQPEATVEHPAVPELVVETPGQGVDGVSIRYLLCKTCYRYTQVIEPQGPWTDPRTYKCGECLEGR